uniref:Uncharacterized protein n=1 Tax=Taenioma perpusillum TaxID=210852 RepID=A0A1Z1MRD8_9FLOR|nr:hypothetical protein [Taenioma perpusillum]ARW68439.1 hypothetical protein [Taenioma perpusillum]
MIKSSLIYYNNIDYIIKYISYILKYYCIYYIFINYFYI